jgi:hypothetical protein
LVGAGAFVHVGAQRDPVVHGVDLVRVGLGAAASPCPSPPA